MIIFADTQVVQKILKPEVNIGTVGHVDHGKTSLVYALTGKWTSEHSEELKRGITIRLGYADAVFYYCGKCKSYTASKKCPSCFSDTEPKRSVSFVDAPGHETLMATVLSGAALMDGALLLVAANEACPQPQTAEHLKALDIAGIKKIVIAQNKIDLVTKEHAMKNYQEIKNFVKGTVAENAPVIPVSAINNINLDMLVEAIEAVITMPERNAKAEPRMYIARSFDVNKPGTEFKNLKGAIIGGSIVQGELKIGDAIEIKPGVKIGNTWKPLITNVTEIIQLGNKIQNAAPGGLVAIQTDLDPALSKSDSLAGNIAGLNGRLPPTKEEIKFTTTLFDHVIGIEGVQKVDNLKIGDILMLTVAIAKTVGTVALSSKGVTTVKLKLPVCAENDQRISISKQVAGRWHLVGYGTIV